MDGILPLPHPDEFLARIDELYQEDTSNLIRIIYYCDYLGKCYDLKRDPELSFESFPSPKDQEEVWFGFLRDEGLFLEFTNPIPQGNGDRVKVRYEDILAYAFGEMGLTPREFYTMTMRDYTATTTGYFFKRWRSDEHLRALLYNLRSIFRSKKDSMPSSVQAFYPLPTDKKTLSFMDEDEIKAKWKAIREYESLQLQVR